MMLDPGTTASARSETDLHIALHSCSCKEIPPAKHIALSMDSDVLDALRATGEDWETHFNAILRKWLRSHAPLI